MSAAETDCEMCYSGVIVCWCVCVVWRVGIVGGSGQRVMTGCLFVKGGVPRRLATQARFL
jgi:hypothetical protein